MNTINEALQLNIQYVLFGPELFSITQRKCFYANVEAVQ